MINAAPGDPAFTLTWLGDEKMPDPIINPTMSDKPFRYVSVLCFSSEPAPNPPLARVADVGAPSGAYPGAAVEESGKRLCANSKVEDTEEKVRAWFSGRPPRNEAGLALSSGSSRSREARRDDEMLGRESVSVVASPGLELAREASSSESRASGCRLE
jgi:hypothetical protein